MVVQSHPTGKRSQVLKEPNMSNPASVAEANDPEPIGAAILVFVVCVLLGAAAGYFIGAATVRFEPSYESSISDKVYVNMVQQPMGGATRAFNWLLFAWFFGVGLVAGAVVWAGGAVVRGQRLAARALLGVTAQG